MSAVYKCALALLMISVVALTTGAASAAPWVSLRISSAEALVSKISQPCKNGHKYCGSHGTGFQKVKKPPPCGPDCR
jgi:hypothetical protein